MEPIPPVDYLNLLRPWTTVAPLDRQYFVLPLESILENELDHVFVWAVGIIGTLAGLGTLLWGAAAAHTKNVNDHAMIITLLEKIAVTEGELEDVLSHPNDTAFSVEPVKHELRQIREKLNLIEVQLKRAIDNRREN